MIRKKISLVIKIGISILLILTVLQIMPFEVEKVEAVSAGSTGVRFSYNDFTDCFFQNLTQTWNGSNAEVKLIKNYESEHLLDANTVALWHCNETIGGTIYDETPNNNNGSLYGTSWSAAGKFEYALDFNGNTDYVKVPTSTSLNITYELSMEAWIYPRSYGAEPSGIIHKTEYSGSSYDGAYRLMVDAGRIIFGINGTFDSNELYGNTLIPTGDWTHVAGVYDGSTMKIYINGVLDISDGFTSSINSTDGDIYIGLYWNGTPTNNLFDGLMDEVRISKSARTPGNFVPFGTLTSAAIDNIQDVNYYTINWTATTTISTTITFQLRTGATQTDLLSTSFVGPGALKENYYVNSLGDSIWSGHNGHRWMQYKAYFYTTDPLETPILNEVGVVNNMLPTVNITTPIAEQHGDIEIKYKLFDFDPIPDYCDIIAEYSTDNMTFLPAMPGIGGNGTYDLQASTFGISYTFIWSSDDDLPEMDQETVYFRITPEDSEIGISNTTLPFHVDNNDLPIISNLTVSGNFSDIKIQYDLFDTEFDFCDLIVEYQGGSVGNTWIIATINESVYWIEPGTGQNVIWHSAMDEYGQEADNYEIRITPFDTEEGISATSAVFSLDNNEVPVVQNISITGSSGEIIITYSLIDIEYDVCVLIVEYQGGSAGNNTWTNATTFEPLIDIWPGNDLSLIWRSGVDESGLEADNYQIRITPMDKDKGLPIVSDIFSVDNNDIPIINDVITMGNMGDILLMFDIVDFENDVCDLIVEYRGGSAGSNWTNATTVGSTFNIIPGIDKVLTWQSGLDENGQNASDYEIMIIPFDNDIGIPGISDKFQLDNKGPRVKSVSPLPESINVEINADIIITFSKNIELSTLTQNAFQIRSSGNPLTQVIQGIITYDDINYEVTIDPDINWDYGQTCEIFIIPIIEDKFGNSLVSQYNWSFTTMDKNYDTDGDHMTDFWEKTYGLDPYNANDTNNDEDFDGLTNLQEFYNGTNPTLTDTDGDDFSDGEEVEAGTDPLDENMYPRKEGDDNKEKQINYFPYILIAIIIIVIVIIISEFLSKAKSELKEKETTSKKTTKANGIKVDETSELLTVASFKVPKKPCKVCEKNFQSNKVAYRCKCGAFYHPKCSSDLNQCMNCGNDIDEDKLLVFLKPRKRVYVKKMHPEPIVETVKPITQQSLTTERCNTCLGPVKTALTLAKWDFGKNHHLTCAYRVGECLECGTKYDKVTLDLDKFIIPQEKEIMEESQEIKTQETDTFEEKI